MKYLKIAMMLLLMNLSYGSTVIESSHNLFGDYLEEKFSDYLEKTFKNTLDYIGFSEKIVVMIESKQAITKEALKEYRLFLGNQINFYRNMQLLLEKEYFVINLLINTSL